ncbi:MAG: DNA primase [Lachnospiraceae bacterium]|nr:DNA primase [Lachnospiraceae bacterium]
MYLEQDIIDQIQQNNDIVDVINEYIPLTKKGANYVCICPFHSDTNPSLTVSRSKQLFKCFACGEGGNVVSFVRKYDGLSFQEALKVLADRSGIALPENYSSEFSKEKRDYKERLIACNTEAARYYYASLRSPRGEKGLEYFKKRKLSDETMRQFGLGYASIDGAECINYLKSQGFTDKEIIDSGLGVYDEKKGLRSKFWNRVMFPIKNLGGKVIAFGGRVLGDGEPKYLNSQETQVFNKSNNLYAFDIVRNCRKDHFILCEGYMDVIALHQAGFNNATASLGTAFTPGQANIIKRYVKDVYLSYDSDGPGVKAAIRAAKICREFGLSCKVIDMNPYKDPDEFIKNLGAAEYKKRIDEAKNAFIFEIGTIRKQYDLNDPDANTRYAEEVAMLLSDFKDEVTRTNYIRACAKEMGVSEDALSKLVSQAASSGRKYNVSTEPKSGIHSDDKKEDGKTRVEQIMLTYLSEYPALYPQIKNILSPEDFVDETNRAIAEKLFMDMDNGIVNPASIVNMFEDAERQSKVTDSFTTYINGLSDNSDVETAVVDIIYQIKNNAMENMKNSGKPINPTAFMKMKKELMEIKKIKIKLPK